MSQNLKLHRISRTDFKSASRAFVAGELYFIHNNDTLNTGTIYVCKIAGNASTAVLEVYNGDKLIGYSADGKSVAAYLLYDPTNECFKFNFV